MLHQSKYKRGCDHTIAHLEFRPSLEGYKHKTSLGEKTSGLFERSSGLSERSTGLCERSSREGERSSSSQLSGVQASTSASYLNSSKSNSRYIKQACVGRTKSSSVNFRYSTSGGGGGFFARHQQRAASELSTTNNGTNGTNSTYGTSSTYGTGSTSDGTKFASKPRRVSLYS